MDTVNNDVLKEGITLYNKGEYSKALGFFLALPENHGADTMEIAYYLGLCYAKLNRYEDALVYLETVVTSGSDVDRVMQCRFLLAVIYAVSGRKRLAEFELNKLLETGYKTASVCAAIAFVAWEQNDTEKCLSYYEKSLDTDPQNVTSLNGMGYVLACEDRDLTKALTLCKRAVEKSPNSAACLDSLGWVYYKLGLFDDAVKYLRMAEDLDKDNNEIAEHVRLAVLKGGR